MIVFLIPSVLEAGGVSRVTHPDEHTHYGVVLPALMGVKSVFAPVRHQQGVSSHLTRPL
jgi:hypothetical protein